MTSGDHSVHIRHALRSLDDADIPHCLYQDPTALRELDPGDDVDVLIAHRDLRRAGDVLSQLGFKHFISKRHPDHRFFLMFVDGIWLMLDVRHRIDSRLERGSIDDILGRRTRSDGVWVAASADIARRRSSPPLPEGRLRRYWRSLVRRRPAGWRRLGPVVAIVGPDGAGKGTLIENLQKQIPVSTKAVYFGFGVSGDQYLGRRVQDLRQRLQGPARIIARARKRLRALVPFRLVLSFFVLRCSLRNWARLISAYGAAWSGSIVLCDRHVLEALTVQLDHVRGFDAIMERAFARAAPWPDAVILLDAPAEEIFRRKQDLAPSVLEDHRRRYARFFGSRGAAILSTERTPNDTAQQASAIVWTALGNRRSW